MYTPDLDWLRQVVDTAVSAVSATLIKQSSAPAALYRLQLTLRDGARRSGILKRIAPDWPEDPHGHLREVQAYRQILPQLDGVVASAFYAGPEPGGPNQLVLLADLVGRYYFPRPQHAWTQAESVQMARAYATFHHWALRRVPAQQEWMLPRHETRVRAAAAELPRLVAEIVALGTWPPLPRFAALLDWLQREMARLAAAPATLLHNDVYPPNVGLPRGAGETAVLIDWEMLGWGLPEMDLAFMFLQPYGSHRQLDRTATLAAYWQARAALGDDCPPPAVRARRQRYADALWAMWLVPVAHARAMRPFPPGSAPRIYWDHMFGVLYQRLAYLARHVPHD